MASHRDRYPRRENTYHWIGNVCSAGKRGGLDPLDGCHRLRDSSDDDILFSIPEEICREFYVEWHEGLAGG